MTCRNSAGENLTTPIQRYYLKTNLHLEQHHRKSPAFPHHIQYNSLCFLFQDKQGIPWWLGLSYKGIFQYDYHDKVKPRKVSVYFSTKVWACHTCHSLSQGCDIHQMLALIHVIFEGCLFSPKLVSMSAKN